MRRAIVCILALAVLWVLPEARADEPASNDPRVSFSLPGLDGKKHELKEWRNKVVLLNFWASWCSPCQTEIRDLVDYQTKYAAAGLQIVGIGLDDEVKLRNVQRSLEINYPVLLDNGPGPSLMSRLGNLQGVVPYTVVVSRKGSVVYTHAGLINKEIFTEAILPLLK